MPEEYRIARMSMKGPLIRRIHLLEDSFAEVGLQTSHQKLSGVAVLEEYGIVRVCTLIVYIYIYISLVVGSKMRCWKSTVHLTMVYL